MTKVLNLDLRGLAAGALGAKKAISSPGLIETIANCPEIDREAIEEVAQLLELTSR